MIFCWHSCHCPRTMFRRHGLRATAFDLQISKSHDILSMDGFLGLVYLIPRYFVWDLICFWWQFAFAEFWITWLNGKGFSMGIVWVYYILVWFWLSHGYTKTVLGALAKKPRLLHGALVVLGPPCSLFVFFSSSLHLRWRHNVRGNVGAFSVRMANRIVESTVS